MILGNRVAGAASGDRLVRSGMVDTQQSVLAESYLAQRSAADTMVFLSHKTGDAKALEEARYIAEKHRVQVYMAEWDDQVSVGKQEPTDQADGEKRAVRRPQRGRVHGAVSPACSRPAR